VTGAPVIAVPGLGLAADACRGTLDRLAPRRTAVVELPGYGRPAHRGAPLDPRDLADRLLGRLDELGDLGAGRVVLLGHSAGCQLVAQAAVLAPDRVVALVLVGPTTDPRGSAWTALVGRWLRTAARERPGQVPQLVRDYHRTGLATMARGMHVARRHRIDRALGALDVPVLVVRGRHDRIAPRDWVDALAACTPRGRAETLPRGAHMVPLTHPALLAARIRAFLAGAACP
jgi:pimeloyl-ACP methyl ester carboxylesterase